MLFGAIRNFTRPYRRVLARYRRNELLIDAMFANSVQFAQFGEDVFVDNHFPDVENGFYVDVGAFHPFRFSNTFLLYRKGWRGINIEPNPEGFHELAKHRPEDINLHNAVQLGLSKVFLENAEAEKFIVTGR